MGAKLWELEPSSTNYEVQVRRVSLREFCEDYVRFKSYVRGFRNGLVPSIHARMDCHRYYLVHHRGFVASWQFFGSP
jgi:hypothetical protein